MTKSQGIRRPHRYGLARARPPDAHKLPLGVVYGARLQVSHRHCDPTRLTSICWGRLCRQECGPELASDTWRRGKTIYIPHSNWSFLWGGLASNPGTGMVVLIKIFLHRVGRRLGPQKKLWVQLKQNSFASVSIPSMYARH